jgi:septum formation protein
MRLVLASASPRRRELLAAAGVACHVDPVDADETRIAGESAEAYAVRVALDKARAGARKHPGDAVLGADTIVVVDDLILGKPADPADAVRMLTQLSGRAHDVLTGVALVSRGVEQTHLERTRVWFSELSAQDIQNYVQAGEPLDKAGAYAIQGLASRMIPRIEGSYTNVVGLPVEAVWRLLRDAGLGPQTAVS